MDITRAVSARGTCDRGRSGCVIVKDKQLLVTGYVGSPKGMPHCDEVGHLMKSMTHEDGRVTQHCVRTIHAEQNAICQAAKRGVSIEGATLYTKMTPCLVCTAMIINSGIVRVVAEKRYHNGAESEAVLQQALVRLDYTDGSVETYQNKP